MSDHYLKDPRANSLEGWIAAFQIFGKYKIGGLSGYHYMAAEHDIFYVADKPAPLSYEVVDGDSVCEWEPAAKDDAEALERLGFHWNSECDSWAKFT
jgi:hypothetical protein